MTLRILFWHPISVSRVLSFQAKNQDSFRLSDDEYVYLTTSGLRLGLDWMPDGDNGYVSGEPPGTFPKLGNQEDAGVPGELPLENVLKLAALVRGIIDQRESTKAKPNQDKHITTQRLRELAVWLSGAQDCRIVDG